MDQPASSTALNLRRYDLEEASLSPPAPAEPPSQRCTDSREAFHELCGMAQGRLGVIPAELMAAHVLRVTEGGDWPVRRAAMEAVIRRWGFARRDELRVADRPRDGRLGTYTTRRTRSSSRPYATQLHGVEPLVASCDCPDFLRSALGVCKHVLVAMQELCRAPTQLERARVQQDAAAGAGLRWDPVRPLLGEGGWMERVTWMPVRRSGRQPAILARAGRWFEQCDGRPATLADTYANDPGRRLELVRDLQGLCGWLGLSDHDAALCPLLEQERRRLQRGLGHGIDRRALAALVRSLERKLYPYQKEGVRRFLEAGRLLLADDMGLGKTAQAVAACHVLWKAGKVRRGLLVVPASLKSQWLREWKLFTDAPVQVVDGSPAQRQATYERYRRGFLIANYEQVLRDLTVMQRWQPELVVLDEAQRIKNWATKTSLYIKQLRPAYRLVLTGTPMENRLEELASILEWVDPLALEPAWRLNPWHTQTTDGRREVAGARNLDTLRARLAGSMLRRVRREVLAQLPPRTDTVVPVELTPQQQVEHDELTPSIAQIMARGARRPLTQAEFLRLMSLLTAQRVICNGLSLAHFADVWPSLGRSKPSEALLGTLSSPKLTELRELVTNLVVEQRRKVVIFSGWRRMLLLAAWAVGDLLEASGLEALFFTGKESQKRRTQNIVDFHDDPRAAVLFATDAGGVGLNLQRAASCCINLELPWNPAVLEQRIGRVYRLGQTSPIEVYNLVSELGIESRIRDVVGNKRALFTGLFDGTSDEVPFESAGGFMGRVERLIELPEVPPPAAIEVEEQEDRDDELAVEAEAVAPPARDGRGEDEQARAHAAPAIAVASPAETTAPAQAPQAQVQLLEDTASCAEASQARNTSASRVDAQQVAALFASLKVRAEADGGLVLKAPPEAAAALSALFRGLADSLDASAPPA